MKTKSLSKIFGVFILLSSVLSSCEKEDNSPAGKLQGTWAVDSFIATDPDTSQEIDFYGLFAAFYPCIKNGTITFNDGAYVTSFPSDCVDEDGESLQIFPTASTGTYTITDAGEFTLNDDGFAYQGTYVFETDQKFVFTAIADGESVKITFIKK